jgi:hypothetical protein
MLPDSFRLTSRRCRCGCNPRHASAVAQLSTLGGIVRMDETTYPFKKMKRFWRWHIAIFVSSIVVTFALAAWRDFDGLPEIGWIWVIPFIVGGCVMVHMEYFVRCPSCSQRLRARKRFISNSHSWRYLYDCPHCRFTWDSGFDQDASSGS